jgi:MarR family transcriptional regulator, lower aerobic nicotinate degradation pathway regulator
MARRLDHAPRGSLTVRVRTTASPTEETALPPAPHAASRRASPAPTGAKAHARRGDAPVGAYRLEDQAGHLMRRAHQRHTALFQSIMGPLALTPTQFAALAKIRDLGQTTQNHLGRLTAMDQATVQGVVQRLVARGFVARKPDPADRRVMVLSLTPAGARAARDAIARAREITRATLAPLTDDERATFVDLLRKLS